jgi:hypothetical protein
MLPKEFIYVLKDHKSLRLHKIMKRFTSNYSCLVYAHNQIALFFQKLEIYVSPNLPFSEPYTSASSPSSASSSSFSQSFYESGPYLPRPPTPAFQVPYNLTKGQFECWAMMPTEQQQLVNGQCFHASPLLPSPGFTTQSGQVMDYNNFVNIYIIS